MTEVTSKFQFKADKSSIDQALTHLMEQCTKISRTDKEAIAHAIHTSAMTFDVDESVLNEAWGNTVPQAFEMRDPIMKNLLNTAFNSEISHAWAERAKSFFNGIKK